MKIPYFIYVLILWAWTAQSQVNEYLFNIDSATKFYHQLQIKAKKLNDTTLLLKSGIKLIQCYLKSPKYDLAEKTITGLERYVKNAELNLKYQLMGLKADVLKYKSNHASALELYLKVYDYFNGTNLHTDVLRIHVDLIEFYRRVGDYRNAKILIAKSLQLLAKEKHIDPNEITRLYNRAAAVYNETCEPDSSILLSRKGIVSADRENDLYSLATSYNELGYTYKNKMWIDSALTNYSKAEKTWKKIGAMRELANTMLNIITLETHVDSLIKRRKITVQKSLELAELVKQKQLELPLSRIYWLICIDYEFLGDSLKAYKYRSLHLHERINEINKENLIKMKDISGKYENEKILKEAKAVEFKLNASKSDLESKNKQNKIIIIFLFIFFTLVVIISYLLVQRNIVNKQLAEKNKKQESLIQEIHHRVKNNLQFINSLISLQMGKNESEEVEKSLSEYSRRVKSMALVHEMLYNKSTDSHIKIKDYLTELVQTICDMVETTDKQIKLTLNISENSFDSSISTALGMITSELVSNSLKHAFKGIAEPTIIIELKAIDANEFQYIYHDNGNGLPDKLTNSKGIGMRLIDIFSRQLKGDYKFNRGNNLKFELNFKTTNNG